MPLNAIDATTLKTWIDRNEAVVIDVREPAEFEAEHIPGAILRPLNSVSKSALPETAGKKLVFQCKAGRRGATACEKLLAEDPTVEIYNLEGGITAWTQAGYQAQRSGKFFLPLDRQVQLTIGVGVLTGVIFGSMIDPKFLLLSAIFGAGLINAGLTGWCGLAMLMAKMPWNQSKTAKK